MPDELFSKSKSFIGKNSAGNLVMQNSTVNNTIFLTGSNNEMMKFLAQSGEYETIQKLVNTQLSIISTIHPLFPEFSAKIDSKINRLVSTPETDEAFKNHPKKIKGTYEIDYKKYPHMDKSETPWEYAYRTQTKVELKTKTYQEYLGDMKDPFPVMTYAEGMVTVIYAPEFPEAVKARIVSGDIEIPVLFRRTPCLEYGKLVFQNVSSGHGFDLKFTLDNSMTFNITKTNVNDLNAQLLREELINNIYTSHKLSIFIEDKELLYATLKDSDLNAEMFKVAPLLIVYIKSLLNVERTIGCHFDSKIGNVSHDDYRTAIIMSSSLENKWHLIKTKFDNEIRFDYDHISNSIFEKTDAEYELFAETKALSISLQGLKFLVDKYLIVYTDAKINNIESILKNIKRKNKNILITIKPQAGKDKLNKYMRFEGISQLH